jgi:DNA replication protein DnaC
MSNEKPMVQVAADPEIAGFIARTLARAEAAAQVHADRMATLPPGTCERCYGTLCLNDDDSHPCPDCAPITVYAPGVPYEFQAADFSNYLRQSGNVSALKIAQEFVASRQRDLFLTGAVGGGKTRLACSIVNESYRRGRGGQFARVPMLLHQLQPGGQASDVRELEQMLFTTPLLVLDDIGAERDQATDYTRRTLYMIYEERYDRRVRTIFTSNKSISELGTMQDDDRLTSRISGRCDVVKLTTPDQRMLRRVK